MRLTDTQILIFAKSPIPGQVKTRLIPSLSAEEACDLHKQLVHRTLSTAVNAALCPVELWCTPTKSHPFFSECAQRYSVSLHLQNGETLGHRMKNAIDETLSNNKKALLIGCDCPVLTSKTLSEAINRLDSDCDVVISPAEDGGYILLGMQRSINCIFDDISWGSNQVLAQTRERLKQKNIAWQEMETLWDLDRPIDLERYYAL